MCCFAAPIPDGRAGNQVHTDHALDQGGKHLPLVATDGSTHARLGHLVQATHQLQVLRLIRRVRGWRRARGK